MRFVGSLAFVLSAAGVAAAPAAAAITSIEIQRTESFAEGATFGATGAYVKVVGVARGELDPAAPANRGIVNLDRAPDRKSTRLNSSHSQISYAVFCLKKKTAGSKNKCRPQTRPTFNA